MNAAIWIVTLLSLTLPAEYRLVDSTSERIPLAGPPGYSATQEFRSWQAPGEKALYLFEWQPYPPRDLGPMKSERDWPVVVAGQQANISETSLFMGRPQRVLAVHLSCKHPEGRAMIYATGIGLDEFRGILGNVKLVAPTAQ